MKKQLFLLMFSVLASIATQAQYFYFETQADEVHSREREAAEKQRRVDNHIGSVKIYLAKSDAGNDAGTLSSELTFDSRGNTISHKMYKENGKPKYHYTYTLNDRNKRTKEEGYKCGNKFNYKYEMLYNDSGNMTDQWVYVRRPDKLIYHSIAKYDDKQNITELKYLGDKEEKQISKYVYSYYPDGSRKQTLEFNKKGKLKHAWNYDCNPAGNLAGKEFKDSSKICIRYETDKDGNKVKIREENVKQGAIVRYVSRYDASDNVVDIRGFDSNGKTRYQYTAKFDDKNNRTEYAIYKGKSNKLKERSIVHYDTSGNVTDYTEYKSAQGTGKTYTYNYTKWQ